MVLTFRSTHGWLNGGVADQVYKAFFDVLKSGGVLGIEQHRAGPKTNREAFSGYVPEETVIAIAEKAGFVLEARSEINANPKDTRRPLGRRLDASADPAARRPGPREVSRDRRE